MEGTPFGRYRLVELIGRGGMGEVWRAYDTETNNRTVAIKLLPPHLAQDKTFAQRFRREADSAARLNNPHVIPIHTYGEIDGRLYVDMRLIEGRDLQDVLQGGALAPDRAVRIIEQVARALHAAHKVGLVHRDVKPSNILIDDDDFAYLIDFGIARAADDTRMTGTGNAIGTFAYMAPERLGERPDEDARADVYALTCVLYECLTGQPPFATTNMAGLVAAHLNTPPPRPSTSRPNVPKQFDQVIATGMAKDRDGRYGTTVDLARAALDAITVPDAKSAARVAPTLPTKPALDADTRDRPTLSATPPEYPDATIRAQPFATAPTPMGQAAPVTDGGRQPGWWRQRKIVLTTIAITASVVLATAAVVLLNQGDAPKPLEDLHAGQVRIGQVAAVSAPDSTLATSPVVTAFRPSIVEIYAVAPGCNGAKANVIRSNGFVVAPDRIITTAHTLAGSESVTVAGGEGFGVHNATVVSHNAGNDVAIVAVDGLTAPPVTFSDDEAAAGASAIVLGYAQSDVYTAAPVRIAEMIELSHRDIYDRQTVAQQVYIVKGPVHEGDAGAPLVGVDRRVLGMLFAVAVDGEETGIALSAQEISHQLSQVTRTQPTSTGACAR